MCHNIGQQINLDNLEIFSVRRNIDVRVFSLFPAFTPPEKWLPRLGSEGHRVKDSANLFRMLKSQFDDCEVSARFVHKVI